MQRYVYSDYVKKRACALNTAYVCHVVSIFAYFAPYQCLFIYGSENTGTRQGIGSFQTLRTDENEGKRYKHETRKRDIETGTRSL